MSRPAAAPARGAQLLLWVALLLVVCAWPSARVRADGAEPAIPRDDPEVMVRTATDRLLEISKEARSYAKEDPERYYAAMSTVLDQVLDMTYFARGVMATYASIGRYRALTTDAERAAFRARVDRFADAIQRVLFEKYADAMLSFDGERIDVAPALIDPDDPGRAAVRQTIYDKAGQTYQVQYNLHKVKDGGWLVYNVIVEDVNIGQIYRSQFAEAVEQHGGDVDYVVDHWVEMMLSRDWKGNPAEEGTAPVEKEAAPAGTEPAPLEEGAQ